jgi:hypothetical protein
MLFYSLDVCCVYKVTIELTIQFSRQFYSHFKHSTHLVIIELTTEMNQ